MLTSAPEPRRVEMESLQFVSCVAGYVAIPPRALSDPDLRKFSDSLLFEPTDTVLTGPALSLHLSFTCAPARSQIWAL